MKKIILSLVLLLSTQQLISCASSTEGGEVGANRRQFLLVPSEQIMSMSATAYDDVKSEAAKAGSLDRNPQSVQRLQSVMNRLVSQVPVFRKDASAWAWEVHLLNSKELNAYCMPGGKIIFYSGIIDQLKLTDSEIAAIMGHEIAHALREHGRERMSQQLAQQIGLQALVATGALNEQYAGATNTILGVTLTLPHSRGQESEADTVGLELMARAGYNPEDALSLWQKMASVGGSKPPEMLSTHPSDESRLREIAALLPKVNPLYQRARQ